MHQIYDYDVYVFDCDGVILDSNILKIEAMRETLVDLNFPDEEVGQSIKYFADNFGLSRFHHIEYFLNTFLTTDINQHDFIKNKILKRFSEKVTSLYLLAEITPGFICFISTLKGIKYVASGSEQQELRYVLKEKGLEMYFTEIFGSPRKKADLVKLIKEQHIDESIIMFGDSVSDYQASAENGIDFICYLPFSNVKKQMKNLAQEKQFGMLSKWPNTIKIKVKGEKGGK